MKTIYRFILSISIALLSACSSGFDSKRAIDLLEKPTLTTEDYSELLQIYEKGFDDAIEFSKNSERPLSKEQKEEMKLIFAIGMRLSKDDVNLTEDQRREFERINFKGTEEQNRNDFNK